MKIMRSITDWKFFIMLIVTIIGVAVSVAWPWYADIAARSLHFQLASQTALQPEDKNAIAGLKITVDGVVLEAPYLSVFELVNDGTKPITAADFESSIELRLAPSASVARASVTATTPKDIEAVIVTEKQAVKLKPFLINPKDTVTIAVISSGKRPQFSSRARIAGVAGIPIEDDTNPKYSVSMKLFIIGAAFLAIVGSMTTIDGVTRRKGVFLRPRAAFLISAVNIIVGGVLFGVLFNISNLPNNFVTFIYLIVMIIAATAAGEFLNKRATDEMPREPSGGA